MMQQNILDTTKKCPKCGKSMLYLGNINGVIYPSKPAQWDVVHVCHTCKCKITTRIFGVGEKNFDYVNTYSEIES